MMSAKELFTKDFLETAPLGVGVIVRDTPDPEVLFINTGLARLLGHKDSARLTGLSLPALWPVPGIDQLTALLKAETPPIPQTLPLTPGWAKIMVTASVFGGRPVWILWVTDISADKQAVADADALAESKSNFLATMSHEIRTPMQSIFGFLELINEEKPPMAIQTMVNTAQHSASGLLEILDDILDFAKMDAQKMELDPFEVPVRTLVRGTLEALAVKVHGKNVQLLDDIETDVPFVILGDPKRLRQIMMNLLGNALKFTDFGTVTVHVTRHTKVIPVPAKGIALRFEIRDTGVGMSAEVCNRLFKPFNQADNSTSRKFGGTGLGLSICKSLVALMGGEIGVESIPGQGSTFWFEIPTEEVSTDASTVELPSLDGISILSVEDHPQGAKEIVKSLQSMGASVESCPTYKEALALVRRRPFDVGIVDQGLPDGLGLSLIREIMTIRPFMGLIMYTVRDDPGLHHSLQSLGVPYLSKPASRLGLGSAVKDAARRTHRNDTDGPARLLIAEDNVTVREVLQRQLQKLGVDADFVSNGRQALAALESGLYGILFTDLHMPEMDGYGLVHAIRAQEHGNPAQQDHFPVIVMTADVQMAERHAYLSEGFDECLLKPVSLGQLRRLLIRWGLLRDQDYVPAAEDKTTPEMNAGQPIDIDALVEQMGAERNEAIEMMKIFVEMTTPMIDELQAAFTAKDFSALHEIAHSLKGAARSACCIPLGDLASQLQNQSEGQTADSALVAEVAAAFEAVREAVSQL